MLIIYDIPNPLLKDVSEGLDVEVPVIIVVEIFHVVQNLLLWIFLLSYAVITRSVALVLI